MSKTEADRSEIEDGSVELLRHSVDEVSADEAYAPAQGEVALAASWGQRGIYVRMSKQRKAALLRFAERSGNAESPHQALSACIEHADAYARSQDGSGNDKMATGGEFDDGNAIDARLDSLEASLARIERAVENGGGTFGRMSAMSGWFANSRDLDQFGPEAMSTWLDALARSQTVEPELTLLTARWAWTAPVDRNSTALSVAYEMGSVDVRAAKNDPSTRIQIFTLPIDSPLLGKTVLHPKQEFVVACRRASVEGSWLVSFFPKFQNGDLGEAVLSLLIA